MNRALALGLVAAVAACATVTTGATGAGRHVVSYPEGGPRFEFTLRDGVPDGPGRAYHPSGAIAHEGAYARGARHGEFRFFDERGGLVARAVYENNEEVWRSTREADAPPTAAPRRAPVVRPAPAATADPRTLAFSLLDRGAAPASVGVQLGVGAAGGGGTATRVEAFVALRRRALGAFVQASQAMLDAPAGMRLTGRTLLEAGGTYHHTLDRLGVVTGRVGVLGAVANDDAGGFRATSAALGMRPADAAAALARAVALRSSVTLVQRHGRLRLQGDVGVDLVLGADDADVDAMVRASVGAGVGTVVASRPAMVSLELASALRAGAPDQHVLAVALGTSLALARAWLAAGLSLTADGDAALLISVGHAL